MNTTQTTPQVGDLIAVTGELPSFGIVSRLGGETVFFTSPDHSGLNVEMDVRPEEPFVVISVQEAQSFVDKLTEATLEETAYLGDGFANWMRNRLNQPRPIRHQPLEEADKERMLPICLELWPEPGDVRPALIIWALCGYPPHGN